MGENPHQMALALAAAGDLDTAEEVLRFLLRAEDHPNLRTNLGTVLLAKGNYAEGARLYEARLQATDAPRPPGLPFPLWRGEDLAGKRLLAWGEQGLGDQLMFARFIPGLQARGCDVTFVCAPALLRLLEASLTARLRPAQGSIEFPDPDVWLWSSSLLAASGAVLETLPSAPYLRAPTRATAPGRIGVVTRGSPTHRNDAHRSLPPDEAERLLALPGAFSLLPEDTGAADMADTAALIAGLDLVIAVDTSVVHLAGAMGKPVWILLPAHATDWRWLRGREDSPWYPTARLFRQPERGAWGPVVDDVVAALRERPLSQLR